ncbi:hypothetical protein [Tateyamaria pelophila]|uniref:hypothetical protein n=1 Tax=Tateyamaria pelophila TaxID=328415 RepID=UPI001CBF34B0|nr:hypothetical protein [Tateyamaria pelophila]
MLHVISRIFSVIFISVACTMSHVGPALSQSGPPTIVSFKVEKTFRDGHTWLTFSWDTRNVIRVILLEGGREMESRTQLSDGSFGWPAKMPPAFSIRTNSGNFTLRVENQLGRVEATASYRDGTCFAWLTPPGTHWSRCRVGGVIATNLSTVPGPEPTSCKAVGTVSSSLNFVARVPNNPFNPAAGVTVHRLDTVWFRAAGQGDFRRANLSGRGNTRKFTLNGLRSGTTYEVTLGTVWRPNPRIVRFNCPSAQGRHDVRVPRLHSVGFSDDS